MMKKYFPSATGVQNLKISPLLPALRRPRGSRGAPPDTINARLTCWTGQVGGCPLKERGRSFVTTYISHSARVLSLEGKGRRLSKTVAFVLAP